MLTHLPGRDVQEQRCISRRQLDGYLQVFNRHTDKPMGYIGNISRQGMMLISHLPILLGSHYELQLRLTASDGQLELINFSALSRWCRADATPGHYDSGFSIVENQQAFAELAQVLERYFSFYHPIDA